MWPRILKWLADAYRPPGDSRPGRGLVRVLAGRLAFRRSVYGVRLLFTPGDRTFELCVSGYGPFIADAIAERDTDFVFLDIGANLGLFSLLAARNPHCRTVIAVEPIPQSFDNLRANVLRNKASKIHPVQGAVSASPEPFVQMDYSPEHTGMARIVGKGEGTVAVRPITARDLDDVVGRSPLPILVKIDVEGAEIDVLTVLSKTVFFLAIDEIIIEVSLANLGSGGRSRLLELLGDHGFAEQSRDGSPEYYDARYRRPDVRPPAAGA